LKSPEVNIDGEIVGIILPNCPQYVVVMLGILEAGLIASPMNAAYKPGN